MGLRAGLYTSGGQSAFGAESKEWFSGAGLSDRGLKACASLEALWARRAVAKNAKQAESFLTKGNPAVAAGGCEIDPGQGMQLTRNRGSRR